MSKVQLFQVVRKENQMFLTKSELYKFISEQFNDGEEIKVTKLRQ